MLSLSLYTRPGCHLCDTMQTELVQLLGQGAFQLDIVDISGNADLMQRYGLRIPVLVDQEGAEICEHRLDHQAVLSMAEQAR